LINWIGLIIERLQLQKRTFYHAVSCMDMFHSMNVSALHQSELMEVTEDQYKLCAVTCLFIAAKSFERDELIPKSSHLNEFLQPD
jgi:hypothetical protein